MKTMVGSLDYFMEHEMVKPWLETIKEGAMIEEGEEGDTEDEMGFADADSSDDENTFDDVQKRAKKMEKIEDSSPGGYGAKAAEVGSKLKEGAKKLFKFEPRSRGSSGG